MGCVNAKAIVRDEDGDVIKRGRGSSNSLRRLVSVTKRAEAEAAAEAEEEVVARDAEARVGNDGSTARLIQKPGDGETKVLAAFDKARVGGRQVGNSHVPNGVEGEHAAAGWPRWLTEVAGEAVRGWLPRKAESFEKLDKIGQGTYSTVYKARDLETGKIVALKKVRFANMDPESVRFMAREIHILRRLDHPNIVKLEGLVTSRMSSSLYLVFEYMEHDLAGLAATPG
uniref:[RNA-polymerase]-subunit kinase n=1 Tax=Ananas comosus var. bracteatus TaxID=296719 RepID=A0A6V7Q7K3_ANACO|nr:unnamed protein product [Ananas comosus var. bracteatus]